jgi:ribosomal protein S18 acetylase RimI-like enzyme
MPTTSPEAREARFSDLPAVAELFDLYRQFYEQPPDLSLARAFISQRMEKRESVILVAENGALGLVGFCQLYPTFCSVEARPIYVLYDLFVRGSARHMGVGRMLLQAAQARAAGDGRARLDLTTAKTNTVAQSLYASLGWVRDDIFFSYSRRCDRNSAASPTAATATNTAGNATPGDQSISAPETADATKPPSV